jgi:hypothetical protein
VCSFGCNCDVSPDGDAGTFGADTTDLPVVPAPPVAPSSPAATDVCSLGLLLLRFLSALESAAASGLVSEFIVIAGEDDRPWIAGCNLGMLVTARCIKG